MSSLNTILPQLESLDSGNRQATARWLQLAVGALAIAGLFALLLVLSRAPVTGQLFPWLDFFRTALVVHVNQSVLIWFLALAGAFWSLASAPASPLRTPWLLALLGCLGIAASAFVDGPQPLMNNYVPVLQHPLFFVTLGLFGVGVALQSVAALAAWRRLLKPTSGGLLGTLAVTLAIAVLLALLVLIWSWVALPGSITGHGYYEYLFWGGGHVLQFAYTQMMLFAWIALALASGVALPVGSTMLRGILWLGILPLLAVPLIYGLYGVESDPLRLALTRLMQYGNGLAALPLGLLLCLALLRAGRSDAAGRPLRLALWMSLLLFASGGLISLFISGVNTIIPAHYHGSTVGVTLALMGFAYLLLPHLGYAAISGKTAIAQPLCYGLGQLLHITGLALSGALGVQRKTAGAAQGLEGLGAKMTMGVMALGGLLAVIGGILFVWIMLRALLRRQPR
ncbi:MAG: cbb3-type cytochrome c oxidase subunit I [Gammaproteobacteria bacterium]|nr:cbb3-type cytochrome c oxidase subunit I [Gammaproteobacteria bacterium]